MKVAVAIYRKVGFKQPPEHDFKVFAMYGLEPEHGEFFVTADDSSFNLLTTERNSTMQPVHYLLIWSVISFWGLGQIWFCQIVIYPLFAKVGEAEYVGYHRFYTSRIPLPVILPGFASFLLPIALAFFGPVVPAWMTAANIALGIVGLLVTVLLEIPRHNMLEKNGKNDRTIAELIRYNWPRTASFTLQAGVTMAMLVHVLGQP